MHECSALAHRRVRNILEMKKKHTCDETIGVGPLPLIRPLAAERF